MPFSKKYLSTCQDILLLSYGPSSKVYWSLSVSFTLLKDFLYQCFDRHAAEMLPPLTTTYDLC